MVAAVDLDVALEVTEEQLARDTLVAEVRDERQEHPRDHVLATVEEDRGDDVQRRFGELEGRGGELY